MHAFRLCHCGVVSSLFPFDPPTAFVGFLQLSQSSWQCAAIQRGVGYLTYCPPIEDTNNLEMRTVIQTTKQRQIQNVISSGSQWFSSKRPYLLTREIVSWKGGNRQTYQQLSYWKNAKNAQLVWARHFLCLGVFVTGLPVYGLPDFGIRFETRSSSPARWHMGNSSDV